MLYLSDVKQFLIDQMIPPDRERLQKRLTLLALASAALRMAAGRRICGSPQMVKAGRASELRCPRR